MSASMRPVVLSLLRSRLLLPLVPLFAAVVVRPFRLNWLGSDLQGALAAIVYLMLVPMLAIAVASGWLRGEVGPWSWALARPIARWRWLATVLLVDVAMLLVSVLLSWCVIGDLPQHWIGPWDGDGPRELGYAALLAIVYGGAAFGGARGATAIGATIYAGAFVGVTVVARQLAVVVRQLDDMLANHNHFSSSRLWKDLTAIASPNVLRRDIVDELGMIAIVLAVAGATAIAVVRAGRSLPARPRVARAVAPLTIAALSAGALLPAALFAFLDHVS